MGTGGGQRAVGLDSASDTRLCFAEEAFPLYAPLLAACQDYARLTGWRFRDGWLAKPQTLRWRLSGLLSSADTICLAQRRAQPTVQAFASSVSASEPALLAEMDRAFAILWSETLRNTMRAVFIERGMWPPSPPPDVAENDGAYRDMEAPVPKIAQRLWNDETRRVLSEGKGASEDAIARTASFLCDFAHEIGLSGPAASEAALVADMAGFHSRIEEWRRDALPRKDEDNFVMNGVYTIVDFVGSLTLGGVVLAVGVILAPILL